MKGVYDSNLNANFICPTSRTHRFGQFGQTSLTKYKMNEFYFNHSQGAANHLLRMNIIDFVICKRQFIYVIDKILNTLARQLHVLYMLSSSGKDKAASHQPAWSISPRKKLVKRTNPSVYCPPCFLYYYRHNKNEKIRFILSFKLSL